MTFVPENYELPASGSKYMEIKDGDNKLRILSKTPFMFYKYFSTLTGKPVLLKEKPTEVPEDVKPSQFSGKKDVSEMWALVVYNYAESKVQILDFNQVSIKRRLIELAKDTDFGDPTGYDIKITKGVDGSGKTTYTVTPMMKSEEVSDETIEEANKIDLTEMAVQGGNPFK